MNWYRKATMVACLAAACALTGCRHGGVASDMMERELRHQEDHIYELKDHLEQYQALLDSCRRENRALKRRLGMEGGEQDGRPGGARRTPARDEAPLGLPSIEGVPNIGQDAPPDFGAEGAPPDESPAKATDTTNGDDGQGAEETLPEPSVISPSSWPIETRLEPASGLDEEGFEDDGRLENDEYLVESHSGDPVDSIAPLDTPNTHLEGTDAGELEADAAPNGDSLARTETAESILSQKRAVSTGPVEKIELNKFISGALNADGRLGDEGIMAVLEPRDADGNLVRASGEVSLMILDPRREPSQAQLVRWDFDADELGAFWGRTMLGAGYQFELPWPGDPPTGEGLQMWARLVTLSGRKFLTHIDVDIEPGGATRPPIGQFRRVEGWKACPEAEVASSGGAPLTESERDSEPSSIASAPRTPGLAPRSLGEAPGPPRELPAATNEPPVLIVPEAAPSRIPPAKLASPAKPPLPKQTAPATPKKSTLRNGSSEGATTPAQDKLQSSARKETKEASPPRTARRRPEWSPER